MDDATSKGLSGFHGRSPEPRETYAKDLGPVAWRSTGMSSVDPRLVPSSKPTLRTIDAANEGRAAVLTMDTRACDTRLDDLGETGPCLVGKEDLPSGEVALLFSDGSVIACQRPRLLGDYQAETLIRERLHARRRDAAQIRALERARGSVTPVSGRTGTVAADDLTERLFGATPTLAEEGQLPARDAAHRARRASNLGGAS